MADPVKGAKVYVTRRVPDFGPKLLESRGAVLTHWDSDEPVPQDELIKRMKEGFDVLYCLLTDSINKEVIDAAGSKLKAVCTMSVGFDHIDVQYCAEKGIKVGSTPGVSTAPCAELTVALLLATCRRIPEAMQAVRSGEWTTWKPLWMCGVGLTDATVGVVGLGRIGFTVAQALKSFSIKKLIYNDYIQHDYAKDIGAEYKEFDDLLKEADFVVVNCALTDKTRGMFNKSAFKKMKKNAVFVNTSRGGVVNQDDLHEALTTGEIYAAGLDVTLPEPLPVEDKLLKLNNCIILPHVASSTVAARQQMSELCAQNVIAALEGKSLQGSPI